MRYVTVSSVAVLLGFVVMGVWAPMPVGDSKSYAVDDGDPRQGGSLRGLAAETSLSIFNRLRTNEDGEATADEQSVLEVFRLEQPEDLTQPISSDAYLDGFIVPIRGRLFRRLPDEFAAHAPEGTLDVLNTSRATCGKWEQGIIGQVYCEANGTPYRVIEFQRPSDSIIGMKAGYDEALRVITQELGSWQGALRLLDLGYRSYIWECREGDQKHFVEAKSGAYITSDAFDAAARQLWTDARAALSQGVAGASNSFSLAPVAREQFMYQTQNGNQCWPTCISMAFDFFGEHISHEDVADVSNPPGQGTNYQDASRAAMFSHNSVPHAGWCCHTGPCPLTYGYNERSLGYSVVHDGFSSDTAFPCVEELTREHAPLLARIIPADSSGHIVVVLGYTHVGESENYVSVFDPNNYANPDTHQVGQDWWRWETDETQPVRRHDFDYYWSRTSYDAMLVAPLPVTLSLAYDSENNEMVLSATVRTCWPFPDADGDDSSWNTVNLGAILKGDPVNNDPLEVLLSYPPNVGAPAGDNPHTFTPNGVDAESLATWSFDASDPDLYGSTFMVTFSGWACDFDAASYSNQTDELGGSASFTLDRNLVRIRNAEGDMVGAIGDQGNLYLAGTLSQFECDIVQDSQLHELYFADSSENITCLLTEGGSCKITGISHGNMNDINDSCTGVHAEASNDWGSTQTKLRISDYTRLPCPSVSQFYVRVHDEIMLVTDSGPTYMEGDNRDFITVQRGQEGTTAVGHENGSQVWLYARGDLASSMDSSQTSLELEAGDAAMFPADFLLARRFPIRVDDENMLVTAVSQDTFTVQRGWNGSTAGTHTSGADAFLAPELVYDEQQHLNHPMSQCVLRIRDGNGDTVAYVDDAGHVRLRGLVFESFTGWGLWQAN